ncbi:unnamed protein product [Microthlaspi erraticum]|uniref:Uncharacterized protein n=1 Tax=Microthlaspi erraticum TaxID=1685480 RepID=A0A6D2IY05_9BRAS|nr:unnamed protein product [Microthlaspi erraticum]
MEFRVLEKKERFLCFQGKGEGTYLGLEKFWADGRFCRGRAIWSAKFVLARDFGRGRSFVSRIDRHGRSVPIQNRPIAAFLSGSCVANGFCRAMINPAEHERSFPARPWSAS